MKTRRLLICMVLAVNVLWAVQGQEPAPGTMAGPPRLDLLTDAQVCPDGKGGYCLTGTAGTLDGSGDADFDFNRGAPLWRSTEIGRAHV